MPDVIDYPLANVDGRTIEQVDEILSAGGRFVMFELALSFLLLTYHAPSKVWLVRDDAEARRIARRYSIPTLLFGWWALPDGIECSLHSLRVNRGGGVDVTSDVRANLTAENLKSRIVRFEDPTDIYEAFRPVSKGDLDAVARCLAPVLERHPAITAAWVGRRVDPGLREGTWPFAIVLDQPRSVDPTFTAEAEIALRRVFRKWVEFEFSTTDDPETAHWVTKQCDRFYVRENVVQGSWQQSLRQ